MWIIRWGMISPHIELEKHPYHIDPIKTFNSSYIYIDIGLSVHFMTCDLQ